MSCNQHVLHVNHITTGIHERIARDNSIANSSILSIAKGPNLFDILAIVRANHCNKKVVRPSEKLTVTSKFALVTFMSRMATSMTRESVFIDEMTSSSFGSISTIPH